MQDRSRDIVGAIAAHLKQWRETHAAIFGEQPDWPFCQHAADFESALGLTGVAQHYRLPAGLCAPDLQSYAMLSWRRGQPAAELERLGAVWNLLLVDNPELKKLVYDPQNADMLYHTIMGVASAYNISDIQHFITPSSGKLRLEMEKTPEFINLAEAFNRCAVPGQPNLKWVAAPETLRLIKDKVIEKYTGP